MSAPKNCVFCFVKLYSLCSYYFDMYILSQVFSLVDNCIFLASMNKVPTLLFICGRFFSFVDPMLTHKSRNPRLLHFSYLQHYNKKAFQWDAYRPLLWFGGGVRYTLDTLPRGYHTPLDTSIPSITV